MFGEEKPINARNMIAEQIMMADLILENDRNFELCGNFWMEIDAPSLQRKWFKIGGKIWPLITLWNEKYNKNT